jgi:transcriptional regulator with PAS, ATPase and Fis domain
LRDAESAAIRAAVLKHKGSRAELARQLGISERSLYRKLRDIEG